MSNDDENIDSVPVTGATGGLIPVNEAAELAGLVKTKSIRAFREDMLRRHEEKGDCLYRFSPARNAQLWTTIAILRREFPAIFGEPAEADGLGVIELRAIVLDLRKRVEKLESRTQRVARAAG